MMTTSILTIKPNQDLSLPTKAKFQCRGHHIQIETHPEEGTSIQIDDGSKMPLTHDLPMSIEGVFFTIKVEKDSDSAVLLAQSDGIEVVGNANDPLVHQIIQSNLRACLETINKVSELEQDERQQGASKVEGNATSDSNRGYALLCQLYLILHANGLDKTEKAQLQTAHTALSHLTTLAIKSETMQLELLRQALHSTTGKPADRTLLDTYSETRAYPYSIAMQKLTQSLTDELMQNGIIYLNYGLGGSYDEGLKSSPGHHEVMKISFDGNPKTGMGKYRWTIYNAGYESDMINATKGLVAGVKEYELNCDDRPQIERFIKLVQERTFRGDSGISADSFKQIDTELKKYVQRESRSNQKSAQIRGNCTTMSTRLCLEEMLSPALFKKLYSFVSNPANLQKLLSTSWQEEPVAPLQTHSKVTAKIGDLANKIAASKAFSTSDKNNAIQDLINKVDIGGILHLLKAEKSKPKISYLQKSLDIKALYDLGNGKRGTLLHLAIQAKALALAEECINLGLTGLEKDAAGYPALHMAIIQGQNDIANMIIHQAKNRDRLNEAANDGVTAIKLALECDRTDLVVSLAEQGADLSPENNNGHVIFNMIMEKALFDPDSAKYVALMNKLILNPSNNNIDPNAVNGLGKSALEIFQGKIIAEANSGKGIDPELMKLLNNLCALDANDQAKVLISSTNLMAVAFPHLDLAVFKRILDAYVATASQNGDPYIHYMGLILPALEATNTEKLEYLLQQKIPGMAKMLVIYMGSLMDMAPPGKCPVSRNAIEVILKQIPLPQSSATTLAADLKKFFSAEDVADIMKNLTIREAKKSSKNEKSSEETILIPSDNQAEIIKNVLQRQDDEISYRQKLSNLFVEQKNSYYKFGDLARAIIKFLTGFDVTRKDASLQPSLSLPEIISNEIRFTFRNLFSKNEVVNKNDQSSSSTSSNTPTKK